MSVPPCRESTQRACPGPAVQENMGRTVFLPEVQLDARPCASPSQSCRHPRLAREERLCHPTARVKQGGRRVASHGFAVSKWQLKSMRHWFTFTFPTYRCFGCSLCGLLSPAGSSFLCKSHVMKSSLLNLANSGFKHYCT